MAEINGQQRLFEMEWKDYGITEWRGAGDMALLLLHRSHVQSPALTLKVPNNFSSRLSGALLWLPWVSALTRCTYGA